MRQEIVIQNNDFWFKVVEYLQQNWALIEININDNSVIVFFMGDTSGVFDKMEFKDHQSAALALRRNGFGRWAEDEIFQNTLAPPKRPFHEQAHPNGPIYSSGRFWKS